jgi:hypothetical protein
MLMFHSKMTFNQDLITTVSLADFFIRFVLNMAVLIVLVRFIYFPVSRRKDYLFTYLLIGTSIFLLCQVLGKVDLQLGMALGLFAVFGIIRYRTGAMPIKEMTYLFVIITISVINALSTDKINWIEIIFANLVLVAIIWGMEKRWLLKHETCKPVIYEKLELIKPQYRNELIADISERIGVQVNRVEIVSIDYMRDIVKLNVYYSENSSFYPDHDVRDMSDLDDE